MVKELQRPAGSGFGVRSSGSFNNSEPRTPNSEPQLALLLRREKEKTYYPGRITG